MDAINYIIITIGFSLEFLLFFIEALLTANSNAVEKKTFLWKTYAKNPRRFSLCCAIAVALGFVMMVVPAIDFLFENSTVFGLAVIFMTIVGVPFGAFRTYNVLFNLSTSADL